MKKDTVSESVEEAKEEAQPLSQDSAELLDAWLRSQEFAAEPDAPDVAALVAYLSGALSADALRSVERGLVLHPSARTQLRPTREALRALRALPWSEAAQARQAEDLTGQVARAWLALAAGSVAAAPSAQRQWQAEGWNAIRQKIAAGAIETKAAWANFLAFGTQLRAAFQRVGPAVARSGWDASPLLWGDLPPDIHLSLSTEVSAEGTLQATLTIQDSWESPSSRLAGTQIQLRFLVNGQTWPLADAEVVEDRAVWTLPAMGTALGLATGSLPAAYFCLVLNDAPPPLPADSLPLLAEVQDAEGKPTAPPVLLELRSEPRWAEEKFHLEIALSGPIRIAYEAYQLRLEVAVFGNFRQCLGRWPIRDWSDTPRLLAADCPDIRDTAVPYASVLYAVLQPLSLP